MDDKSWVALTFADYVDEKSLADILTKLRVMGLDVRLINHGPDDSQMAQVGSAS